MGRRGPRPADPELSFQLEGDVNGVLLSADEGVGGEPGIFPRWGIQITESTFRIWRKETFRRSSDHVSVISAKVRGSYCLLVLKISRFCPDVEVNFVHKKQNFPVRFRG